MKIIKNTKGEEEAENRLLAAMLNMEAGCVRWGDDGKHLPAPWAPFPTIDLPPRTRRGLPVKFHYKPATAVVFYSAGPGFNPVALAQRMKERLEAYGYVHLRGYRAVSAAPAATIRATNRFVSKTELDMHQPPIAIPTENLLPARLIAVPQRDSRYLPTAEGEHACFTWVFVNGGAALDLSCCSLGAFNTTVASIFYDNARVLRVPDGKIITELGFSDLIMPKMPPGLKAAIVELEPMEDHFGRLIIAAAEEKKAVDCGEKKLHSPSLLIKAGGDLEAIPWQGPGPHKSRRLPFVPWPNLNSANQALDATPHTKCLMCDFPLWGDIVALVAPREPDKAARRDYHRRELPKGEDILHGRSVLLCRCCTGWIPDEAITKLRAALVATRLERTQAQAFDGYAVNALLSLGKATKAKTEQGLEIPGAFIVGDKILLYASETLTDRLLIGIPELLMLSLPTIIKRELAAEIDGGANTALDDF